MSQREDDGATPHDRPTWGWKVEKSSHTYLTRNDGLAELDEEWLTIVTWKFDNNEDDVQ